MTDSIENISPKRGELFKRLLAFVVDAIIAVLIIEVTIQAAFLIFNILSNWFEAYIDDSTVAIWRYSCLITVIPFFYTFALVSKFQATPGKYMMGLYVATTKNKKLNIFQALARYFLCFGLAIILYGPYIYMPDVQIYNKNASHPLNTNFFVTSVVVFVVAALQLHDFITFTRVYEKSSSGKLYIWTKRTVITISILFLLAPFIAAAIFILQIMITGRIS